MAGAGRRVGVPREAVGTGEFMGAMRGVKLIKFSGMESVKVGENGVRSINPNGLSFVRVGGMGLKTNTRIRHWSGCQRKSPHRQIQGQSPTQASPGQRLGESWAIKRIRP